MKSKITKEDIEFTNGEEIIGFVKVTSKKLKQKHTQLILDFKMLNNP